MTARIGDILSISCPGKVTVGDWVEHYGHSWHETGEVLVEGRLIKRSSFEWIGLVDEIFKDGHLSTKWRYAQNGFQEASQIKWTKLEPTHKRPATGKHFIEVVTSEHASLRLEDRDGNVTSVGFFGPLDGLSWWRRGAILSPDPLETETCPKKVTRIELSEADYKAVVERIEKDKNEGREAYNFAHRNCSVYVREILKDVLNLDVDNREFIDQILFRNACRKMGITQIGETTLKVVHVTFKIFRFLASPFWMAVSLLAACPFIKPDGVASESYKATFGDQPQKTWMETIISFFNCDYVKASTTWRMSAWQDHVKEEYDTHEITLEQARKVTLAAHTAFAP